MKNFQEDPRIKCLSITASKTYYVFINALTLRAIITVLKPKDKIECSKTKRRIFRDVIVTSDT